MQMTVAATGPRTAAPAPGILRTDLPAMLRDLHDIDGPRPAGTPQLKAAAELVASKVGQVPGWTAHVEPTRGSGWGGSVQLYNVVADHAGTAPEGERKLVIAGAHLDTVRSAPGGNDDGTGSVALLGLARALGTTPTRDDVRLVWFDGEEQGLLGSKAYVRDHADDVRRTKLMVEAEMLGSPHGSPVLLLGGRVDERAAQPVLDAAAAVGIAVEVPKERPWGSDHNPFADAGAPAMVLSTTAPIGPDPERRIRHDDPAYHSSADTIAHLKTDDVGRLSDVFATAIASAAGAAPSHAG
jgi:aminopeptidase S